jgi:TPR repeat
VKVMRRLDRIQPPGFGALVRQRERSQVRRSHRIAPAWPQVVACCLVLVACVCLLLAVAYAVGHGPGASSGLRRALATTIAKPAVALGLGAVIVLIIGACLRRIWLERLVRLPGPILVRELTVPATLSAVDVAGLSTTFRARLQRLRLQAATPVPGAIPAQNFLEMLDSEHLDSKNPLASLVSLLRAAIPSHAYEVSAELVVRCTASVDGLRYAVTAQVTRLPHEAIPVQTGWMASCEDAVIQAADIVTGAILPRTRLSNQPPWSGWRRYAMDSLLVHHFECAEELTIQRRYDEALDTYARALELDPKNVDIRLHQGFVQEKLGLFLDALATYAAARKIADETSHALYHFRARRDRRASGRIACYRLAVLLAGEKVAHQWRKRGDETLREQQRQRLRERLKPELIGLLADHELIKADPTAGRPAPPVPWRRTRRPARPPQWTRTEIELLLGTEGNDDAARAYELRRVLAELAKRILDGVELKLRRPWAPRTWLSPLTVKLTIEGVELRQQWVEHQLKQPSGEAKRPWQPPEPAERTEKFCTWPERYNAACLYAWPLLVTDEPTWGKRVTEAVKQLEAAMSSATSWYVASRRDWVLSEDPDLRALRQTEAFKHFETIYLPSATQTPERPENVQRWEQSRYTHELLAATAQRWERVWHQRRDEPRHSSDPHVVLGWCADEAKAWQLARTIAREYRHWRARYELIEEMAQWSARYGFARLEVGTPRFESRPPTIEVDDINREIRHNERRLRHLGEEFESVAGQQLQNTRSQTHRDFWRGRAPKEYLRHMCDARAALWHTLHEWIDELPQLDDGMARREFTDAMARAGDMSRSSHRMTVREARPRWSHIGTAIDAADGAGHGPLHVNVGV